MLARIHSPKKLCYLTALVLLVSSFCFAASDSVITPTTNNIDWSLMLLGLFAGLAFFLLGMDMLASGLRAAAGAQMKNLLARFTNNRFKAALTGSVVTALVQSSSITTVLTVGFVSSGLMTLTQSVGVIMGANIGSTLTAQIVAFDIGEAALAMIALGFAVMFISKKKKLSNVGKGVLGFGLIFYGMMVMSDGMYPLRSYPPFTSMMAEMEHPLFGILCGALFTALVQSSAATTGIVIAFASQGVISLPAGIALVFGANIGTCATAILATLGKSDEARRVAVVHVIFNVIGVLLWVAFIPHLAAWVSSEVAGNVPRQIANAHAIFNISNTLILLPVAGVMAYLAEKIIPERIITEEPVSKFLDDSVISIPSVALVNARLEAARMGDKVYKLMLAFPSEDNPDGSKKKFKKLQKVITQLNIQILDYLANIRRGELSEEDSIDFQNIMITTDALESISELLINDLIRIEKHQKKHNISVSKEAKSLFANVFTDTATRLKQTLTVFSNEDKAGALQLLKKKDAQEQAYADLNSHQEMRFSEACGDRLDTFRLEMRFVSRLRNINMILNRILAEMAHLPSN